MGFGRVWPDGVGYGGQGPAHDSANRVAKGRTWKRLLSVASHDASTSRRPVQLVVLLPGEGTGVYWPRASRLAPSRHVWSARCLFPLIPLPNATPRPLLAPAPHLSPQRVPRVQHEGRPTPHGGRAGGGGGAGEEGAGGAGVLGNGLWGMRANTETREPEQGH